MAAQSLTHTLTLTLRIHTQIVAAQSLTAGQEVHNTYGEHSNRQLLNKHGFTLRHNPFDVIEVRLVMWLCYLYVFCVSG